MEDTNDYSELIYMLKKCRAVLNMAGYYDMVVAIDNLLENTK